MWRDRTGFYVWEADRLGKLTHRSSVDRCYRNVTDIVVDPLPTMSLVPLLPRVASV